jgi:hypothetical protein
MVRKAVNGGASLSLTDLGVESGAHWRGYADIVKSSGEQALWGVFDQWFSESKPTSNLSLIYDPAPNLV